MSDGTGYYDVTVREQALTNERDLGYKVESEPPEIRGVQDYGCGTDLKTPAFQEIRETLDLKEFDVGEHVARIHLDLDSWTYSIEYVVEVDR